MKTQKMSNGKFRKIMIPIASVLAFLIVALTIAADICGPLLDHYLGFGEGTVSGGSGNGDYYSQQYFKSADSREAVYAVNEKVSDEGMILLKNNGVLPLAEKSTVTPMGYRYYNPTYGQPGGWGSGKPNVAEDSVTPEAALSAYFNLDKTCASKMKGDPSPVRAAPGTLGADKSDVVGGVGGQGNINLYEYNPDETYGDPGDSLKGTTAIIFFGREGQEGMDYKYDAYEDGTPHFLALSQNERATVRYAKENCDKVVVVFLASAVMEVSPLMSGELEVDAILWAGHPGERGLNSLGKILTGKVNPSGRTVDIFPTDFTKDPTYINIGEMAYSNYKERKNGKVREDSYYVEYEEGVYLGYRYYETADALDDGFVYGELDGKGAVKTAGAVTYPFGYGLSYTSFTQTLKNHAVDGGKIRMDVEVANAGEAEGKDVVQVYVTAPYTDYDRQNGIEKSEVALLDFAKTDVVKKGESQTVSLEIDREDLTCYDSSRENPDGSKGCYILEAGDYVISLRKNSHEVIDSFTYTVEQTIYYDSANPRNAEKEMQAVLDDDGVATDVPADGDKFIAATNLFPEMTEYMNECAKVLSRSDWKGTQQTSKARSKEIPEKYSSMFERQFFDYETDAELGNVAGSKVYSATAPASAQDNGLTLSELRGKDYNDPAWEKLLDQIDWSKSSSLSRNLFSANYMTNNISEIGLSKTKHADGANGIKIEGKARETATMVWAPVMSATWNKELLYELGKTLGQEAITNGIYGWYSPAFNLHRTPFCGRIFEYYSEDPVLSGMVATAVVSGTGESGLQCFIKHFALNDEETNRANYLHAWASEQTAREMYLKPFEMVIRDARMTVRYYGADGNMTSRVMRASNAMMTAQNCFGTTIAMANYDLVTGLVRNEWGFKGVIITDMYYSGLDNSIHDLVLRSGGDIYLCTSAKLKDHQSATARTLMREAIHHLAYSVTNSNAMQGIAPGATLEYGMSPWKIALIAIDVTFGVAVVVIVALIVLRQMDENKNPGKYLPGKSEKTKKKGE